MSVGMQSIDMFQATAEEKRKQKEEGENPCETTAYFDNKFQSELASMFKVSPSLTSQIFRICLLKRPSCPQTV